MRERTTPSLIQTFRLGFEPAFATVQNAVEYRFRQLVRWRRGAPQFENESKQDLFDHLPVDEREKANETALKLQGMFHLRHLYRNSSTKNYRINLFYAEMLDRALSEAAAQMPSSIHAADIGPSDWFYVQALFGVLKWWHDREGRAVQLRGYEADAYRVRSHLFSRFDLAHGHMNELEGVRYIPHQFSRQKGEFDIIMMLFPFVFVKDHLAWGLPLGRFNPVELLRDAWASLKPGGVLVIVNQGEAEHKAQLDMLASENVRPSAAFRHSSLLYHYNLARYVLVGIRNP